MHRRRPGAEFGGREKISQTKNVFLGKKFPFSRSKFLMILFKVIDHDFRIFPMFYIFDACNVVFDPFLTRKTPISENNSFKTPFLLCSCVRTHPTNATSQNIGEDGCMGRHPHLKFWGDRPPIPPRSPSVNLSH